MEGCLLCLNLNKNHEEVININSKEWQELNMQYLIDKHLWPMNHYESFDWICGTCCNELQAFHRFYSQIEETHIDFGFLAKKMLTEIKDDLLSKITTETNVVVDKSCNDMDYENEINIDKNKTDEYNERSNEEFKYLIDNFESEINIEEDTKPLLNDVLNEQTLNDSKMTDQSIDMPLKRKRGRPRKDGTKTIKSSESTKKTRKSKDIKNINNDHATLKEESLLEQDKEMETKNDIDFETVKSSESTKKTRKSKVNNDHTTLKEESLIDQNKETETKNDSDFETATTKSVTTSAKNKNLDDMDKFLAENFKITCYICNIPMETFSIMRKHFDVHHNGRGHVKCCNKKIFRRNILADHIHRHLDPNYFKCPQCDKVLADRRCLELHMELHEGIQEKIHSCEICGKSFGKISILKIHRMTHMSEEEKRFPCTVCGKNFASKYLLSCHNRYVHLKTYAKVCDICGKTIYNKDVFDRHMLQHEGKKAPTVNCEICGLILTDQKALKRHKNVVHPEGGQTEYKCTICSKISPNQVAHKRHVKFKHEMGYDHICSICDKAFKRAQTLREHMASHTGTVLYTCPWCPKTFNSNANMHHHRKKIHPKEWEETSRKRYSGKLPPYFKPPTTHGSTNFNLSV